MRWLNGFTWEEYLKRKKEWHDWFAWFPVTYDISNEGRKKKVWLETIEVSSELESSCCECWWKHSYRLKE